MKSRRWRGIVILVLTLLGLYSVAPTFVYFSQPTEVRNDQDRLKEILPKWLPSKHINLGLDLQGGVQLVLGVTTDDAIDNKLNRIGTELTRWAEAEGINVGTAYVLKGERQLRVELGPDVDTGDFKVKFKEEFPGLQQSNREGQTIDFAYSDDQMQTIKQSAIEQALRVVRSRIDKWGVSEPLVTRRGTSAILVQLPGFKNPEKARELLGRTAQLKFKIVDSQFRGFEDLANTLPEGVTVENLAGQTSLVSESKEQILEIIGDRIPADKVLMFSREELAGGKKYRFRSYVLNAATELAGEDVLDAYLTQGNDLDRLPAVGLKFTGPGGKRFADITGANVGKYMAIILDNEVQSAPVIQQKISGGQAQINMGGSGGYNESLEEANQLVLILKSGALPATIEVLEERQVGATLGPELASQGVKGSLLGLGFVLIFMLVYYRKPGVIACTALVLNAILLLACMSAFGFALTLPGIAGFILTLGMAVDANVLINERIRQEVRAGKNAKKSVHLAFEKVFWTIIDANVTTLIAAVVLLETNSSGPIRGFAITLIIGLIVSMFTSLYCTRFFFEAVLTGQKSDAETRKWLGGAKDAKNWGIPFLTFGKPITAMALGLVVAVIGTSFVRGGLNWGVDFKGGAEMLISFSKDIESGELRDVTEDIGLENVTVQALSGTKSQYALRFDTEDAKDQEDGSELAITEIKDRLVAQLGSYGPDIQQVDYVGPQIGQELRNQGLISVIYAIMGVLLYIALRFDMRFGPGAVVKMVLDILIMLGFYVFFWESFDLTSVAAFLTVVGYSVNDTIVIYDRIRENMMVNAKRKLRDTINASLNETFTRTLNTSITTVAALTGILIFTTGQMFVFAMSMTIGVIVATISSTFIASSFILWLENWKKSRPIAAPAK